MDFIFKNVKNPRRKKGSDQLPIQPHPSQGICASCALAWALGGNHGDKHQP